MHQVLDELWRQIEYKHISGNGPRQTDRLGWSFFGSFWFCNLKIMGARVILLVMIILIIRDRVGFTFITIIIFFPQSPLNHIWWRSKLVLPETYLTPGTDSVFPKTPLQGFPHHLRHQITRLPSSSVKIRQLSLIKWRYESNLCTWAQR